MTDSQVPTPAQLGLPPGAPQSQYQAALKAAGFTTDEAPLTGVEAAPEPVVPTPPPLTEPTEPTSLVEPTAPVVVATFRDPGGSLYTVTRS